MTIPIPVPPPAPDYAAIARRRRRKLAERILLTLIESGYVPHGNDSLAKVAVGIADEFINALQGMTDPHA